MQELERSEPKKAASKLPAIQSEEDKVKLREELEAEYFH